MSSRLRKLWLASFLYTFLDGAIVFYLSRALAQLGLMELLSLRYAVGLLLSLAFTKRFYALGYRELLSIAMIVLMLAEALLIPGPRDLWLLGLSLGLLGVVDFLFWASSTGYIERISTNFDRDIALFAEFTLLGYAVSSIYGKLLVQYSEAFIIGIMIIIINYLLFRQLPSDRSANIEISRNLSSMKVREQTFAKARDVIILSTSFFFLFAWLASYFLVLPNSVSLLGLAVSSSVAYGIYNLGRFLGALGYLENFAERVKAFRKKILALYASAMLASLITLALLMLRGSWILVSLDLLLAGALYSILYQLWLSVLRDRYPEVSVSGEIGDLVTLGSESAFLWVPVALEIWDHPLLQSSIYIILYYAIVLVSLKLRRCAQRARTC
jgi:hypothetical protein